MSPQPRDVVAETEAFYAALQRHDLIIELAAGMFSGRKGIRLLVPGATPRSKPVQVGPAIVGDPGDDHPDLLETVAAAMRLARGVDE